MTAIDVDAIVAGLPAAANGYHDGEDDSEATADAYGQLPEEFWTARPALAHIRDAARSRLVGPDAVFGTVLARVAAITAHTVELPPTVGSPVGLSFFTVTIGNSSAGKSAAGAVAAELLPAPPHVLDGLPLGSGEGMVDVLFATVDEADETGKVRKVKRQTRNAAVFRVDEGAVLAELGGRRGSTLLSTLRSVFVNAPIGNTNASVETRRILDGRAYVYGITVGLQPTVAGPLLADVDAGTPQRFLWMSATDPGATDEATPWPGPLGWSPPSAGQLESHAVDSGGWRRHRLRVDATIVAEVRAERLAVMREEVEVDPLDAHATLVRLKVAGLLAILDGRCDMAVEDWTLAGTVVATSRQVRLKVQDALDGVARRREAAATAAHARREVAVDVSKEERALLSGAGSAARVVARHSEAREHEGGGCGRRCLGQAVAGQHKALVGLDSVIAAAEARGWLRPDGGQWFFGDSRPA